MKILHINTNNAGGGVEQYLKQLCSVLNRRGHSNALLFGRKYSDQTLNWHLRSIFIEGITHFKCLDQKAKLETVKKNIDRLNPDIIYIHQVFNSALIEYLTSIKPAIRFVHDFKLVCPDGAKILKSQWRICTRKLGFGCQLRAYRYRCMPRNPMEGLPLIFKSKKNIRIHKKRTPIVVASEFMKSILLANGFKNRDLNVIQYFTELPVLKKETSKTQSPRILALGRIAENKGMHQLLKAFKKVSKDAHLEIVGNGPDLNKLVKAVEDPKICSRVNLTGWLSHDKLDRIFRNCSIVVIPSIWPEPFGIVGIEALSYGKPVVASDVGGISEWCLDGTTGFLTSPGDVEMMAEKINYLIEHPTVANEFGENGRRLVENKFTAEIHLERLERLFSKVSSLSF